MKQKTERHGSWVYTYRKRWWWPFWVTHTVKYDPPMHHASEKLVKETLEEMAAKERAKSYNTTLRSYDKAKPPPTKPEKPRAKPVYTPYVSRGRGKRIVERRDDSSDLLTGIIIGAALAGSSSSPAEARPAEPAYEGRGGSYGGGGAEGSWSSDSSSSSSSSSDSYSSSSSDSSVSSGGGE